MRLYVRVSMCACVCVYVRVRARAPGWVGGVTGACVRAGVGWHATWCRQVLFPANFTLGSALCSSKRDTKRSCPYCGAGRRQEKEEHVNFVEDPPTHGSTPWFHVCLRTKINR